MRYPSVYSEDNTMMMAAAGASIARYGDGELRIALGGHSISQKADAKLTQELRSILVDPDPRFLACIPNIESPTPRAVFWSPYYNRQYTALYGNQGYGSSFITRPDNAPWIDRPDYWDHVRSIWRFRSVVLVSGDRTLADVVYKDAKSLSVIPAPKRDAYGVIDELETQCTNYVRRSEMPVLIALGAAGTALAARLAKRGLWALDLGHIGQFMKPEHEGAFAFSIDDLASPEYRALLKQSHAQKPWGRGGYGLAPEVDEFCKRLGNVKHVLDYGSGGGTFKAALEPLGYRVAEWDPGTERAVLPKLCDVVSSSDVLEHVEPEKIDNVLRHIYLLAKRGAYLMIAKQPAKRILPDGRNAHLICQPTEWWLEKLRAAGWSDLRVAQDKWKKCTVECIK